LNRERHLCSAGRPSRWALAHILVSTIFHHNIVRFIRPTARKCGFVFSTVCDFFVCFFVCHSNISGTAQRICAKFTGETCLVPRSDILKFKVKGQGHQGQKHAVHTDHTRQRRNRTRSLQMTSRSSGRHHSVAAGEVISAACVLSMFGKTSLALVIRPHFISFLCSLLLQTESRGVSICPSVGW